MSYAAPASPMRAAMLGCPKQRRALPEGRSFYPASGLLP